MDSDPLPVQQVVVHALVVTSDNSDLSTLFQSLGEQTRMPDAVTVVTVGGAREEMVRQVRNRFDKRGWVVEIPSAKNFGDALRQAFTSSSLQQTPAWYWLLHDDVRPEPEALEELLAATSQGANIDAVGPKQVDWDDRGKLLELGIEATSTARRVPLGVWQEIDQGQYDDRTDVLAVGTAGMLVRASTWKEMRGLDPQLGPYGDGLEFGKRLRRSGKRVVVAPRAVVAHRQQTLNAQGPAAGFRARRSAQLYNWLVGAPPVLPVLLLVWLTVWSPLRAAARLVGRQPGLAAAELGAYVTLLLSIPALVRGRRRTARTARIPRRNLRPLEATPAELEARRRHARKVRRARVRPSELIDPISRALLAAQDRASRVALTLVVLVSSLASAYFWYPLAAGAAGARWANLPGSASLLWQQAWSQWVFAGVGSPGPTNPILTLFAIPAVIVAPLGWDPTLLMRAVLFAALPLAALGGWMVARLFTAAPWWKAAAALTWSFQPGLLIAVGQADLPATLSWLGAPLIVAGLWRATRPAMTLTVVGVQDFTIQGRYDPITWGAVASFGTLISLPSLPVVPVVVAAVGYSLALLPAQPEPPGPRMGQPEPAGPESTGTVTYPSRPPLAKRLLAVSLGWVPAALLGAPLYGWLLTHPQLRALLGPAGAGTVPPAPLWIWVAALTLILGAALALIMTTFRPGGSAVTVRVAAALSAAVLWVNLLVGNSLTAGGSLVAIGLLVAALAGLPATRIMPEGAGRRLAPLAATFSLVTGCATFVGLLAIGPLTPGQPDALISAAKTPIPLVSQEAARSDRQGRTLILTQAESGTVEANLWRDGAPSQAGQSWGIEAATLPSVQEARTSLIEAVGHLAAGPSEEAVEHLAAHAIEIVILTPQSLTEHGSLHANLDSVEGLQRIGTVEAGTMWRVRPGGEQPAELTSWPENTLTGRKFATSQRIPQYLVLAEPADPHWTATLEGVPLAAASDPDPGEGWRQAFLIPEGATPGSVSVSYQPVWAPWWVLSTAVGFGFVLVCSLPWRVRRPEWKWG